MNEQGMEEIISTLYEMIQNARNMPFGADKVIVERDKVLDLLDELTNQLPGELKQAKTIVESRSDVINNAKREAENILKQAQQQARQLISQEAVFLEAKQQANGIIRDAQAKSKELKSVAYAYVDNAMKQTEEAIAESLAEIRESRGKFRALVNPQARSNPAIIEDI